MSPSGLALDDEESLTDRHERLSGGYCGNCLFAANEPFVSADGRYNVARAEGLS